MKADNELQVPTVKRRPLAATARLKTHVHPFCKMSRSAVISVPSAEKKQHYVDTRERGGSEDMNNVDNCSKERSDAPSWKDESNGDTPQVPPATMVEVSPSSRGTASEEGDFRVVVHSPSDRPLTRDEIEELAWANYKLKFSDGDTLCVPPPPTAVEKNGLYILIDEVPQVDLKIRKLASRSFTKWWMTTHLV